MWKRRLSLRFSGQWISEVSFIILAMVLCYFSLGTRQSSWTLFPLFAAKTSSRFFDGFCEFSNRVAIPESKCLFGNRDGRATRAAQQHLLRLRLRHFPVSLISEDGNNSLLGTNNVHLDTNNSLMGSKLVFRDTNNSLLGTMNNSLVGTQIVFRGATSNCLLRANAFWDLGTCTSSSDYSQAKQTSLLQRFELFCKRSSRELSLVLTMRIRLRLLVVIHTISKVHLLVK